MNTRTENASLKGAEFASVDLSDARFQDVNLSGARFNDVSLAGTSFEDVSLSGATISDASSVLLRTRMRTSPGVSGRFVVAMTGAWRSQSLTCLAMASA